MGRRAAQSREDRCEGAVGGWAPGTRVGALRNSQLRCWKGTGASRGAVREGGSSRVGGGGEPCSVTGRQGSQRAVPLESCPGFLDIASEAQPLSLRWTLTTAELVQRCLVQRAGALQRVVSPGALPSPSPEGSLILEREEGRLGMNCFQSLWM